MTDNIQKIFKNVEKAASGARKTVIDGMRNSEAQKRIEENIRRARKVKKLKREKHLPNSAIAERMGISESTVRSLLLLPLPEER